MHTGSLLTRLCKLQQCEDSFGSSDRVDLEAELESTEYIEFKDSPAWSAAYHELKNVLACREHLPSAAERKARRKSRRG